MPMNCTSATWIRHSQLYDSGDYTTEFMVKGKSVCREVWLLIHSINKEWLRRLFSQFRDGAVEVEHGNKDTKKPSQRSTDRIAWLEFFDFCVGQYYPTTELEDYTSTFLLLPLLDCHSSTQFSVITFRSPRAKIHQQPEIL